MNPVHSQGTTEGTGQEKQDSAFDKFSLREIVMRHQAQPDMKFTSTVGRFKVERPNKYAVLETDEEGGAEPGEDA